MNILNVTQPILDFKGFKLGLLTLIYS